MEGVTWQNELKLSANYGAKKKEDLFMPSDDLMERTAYAFGLSLDVVQELFASAVAFGFSSNDIELCIDI